MSGKTEASQPRRLIACYGTFAGDFDITGACPEPDKHWWHAASPWWQRMAARGFVPFRSDDFVWSGDLVGLERFNRWLPWNWFRPPSHKAWFAGAEAAKDYVLGGPPDDTYVVAAHSHGGQVFLYAAALGLHIPVLITIATPNRSGDMGTVTKLARPNIGRWVHVFDDRFDAIGLGGQFGDGKLDFKRSQPLADVNIPLPSIQHSRLVSSLDDQPQGLWDALILPAALGSDWSPTGQVVRTA